MSSYRGSLSDLSPSDRDDMESWRPGYIEPGMISCPGCGALCDRDAIGDHDRDCPEYGENVQDGPDEPEEAAE